MLCIYIIYIYMILGEIFMYDRASRGNQGSQPVSAALSSKSLHSNSGQLALILFVTHVQVLVVPQGQVPHKMPIFDSFP